MKTRDIEPGLLLGLVPELGVGVRVALAVPARLTENTRSQSSGRTGMYNAYTSVAAWVSSTRQAPL